MIPEKLQKSTERIAKLCRKFGISELSVFGSQVRGEAGLQSDFDFLVLFLPEAEIGFIRLGQIEAELSEIVSGRVDVVPKDGLKLSIQERVLAEAEVIYAE